jgi:hypothetical protein
MSTLIRTIAAPLAAAALVLGTAGTAAAQSRTVSDPADTSGSLGDISLVTVKHTSKQVRTTVLVDDLRPTSKGGPSSLSVFIDTDRDAKGPEFRLATGMQEGTDFQLVAVKDWKPVGEPLGCAHSVDLDFGEDTARLSVARACVGSPEDVRVGVKMTDAFDPSHVLVDWLKKPRGFTTWLAAG